MTANAAAGTLIPDDEVLDVGALIRAFFDRKPDPLVTAQRVSFGTSGHRGCALDSTFNEGHIVAITEAICRYRRTAGITGPLFIGRDTHAVSEPAFQVAIEVLTGNGITVLVDALGDFTPTPVVSHAILTYNKGRSEGLADGIVVTPSHNPPRDGGFKYNPPHGGPADTDVTRWIESTANELLRTGLSDIRRLGTQAAKSPLVSGHPYRERYLADLTHVIDLDRIAASGLRIGVDPLGGAAARYWQPLAERYGLALSVTDTTIDPTFKTIPRDWDGQIRMDCSSRYPMQRLLSVKDRFDIAFANDTDADRHGIVTPPGLMPANDFLATCVLYLAGSRPGFSRHAVGKTVVSSSMIDRAAAKAGSAVHEVPVGFKWFVDGLKNASVYFAGEESAGASFLRRDGSVWTTDKDGIIAGLLAAEMLAQTGQTPDTMFSQMLVGGAPMYYARLECAADVQTKAALLKMSDRLDGSLGGDAIEKAMTKAPGNDAPIGGVKLVTKNGWAAARPSGTEDVIKLYAESYQSAAHLRQLQEDAAKILNIDVQQAS